jgi:hypothetical protein
MRLLRATLPWPYGKPAMQDGHRTFVPHVEVMRRFALLLAVLVLAGCVGTPTTDSGFTVRDSAGIQIAESMRPEWPSGAEWTIDPVPVVEIGKTEGEDPYLFSRIAQIAVLGNGSIAVVELPSREVRIFDLDGQHLATFGGQGGGPGKFLFFPKIVAAGGDTVLTWEGGRTRRRQWFLSDGTFLRDDGLPLTVGSAGNSFSVGRIVTWAIVRDGTLLAPNNTVPVANGQLLEVGEVFHIIGNLGERVAAVGDTFPIGTSVIVRHGKATAQLPFGSLPAYSFVYPPAELVVSGPARWQMSSYGPDGALSRVIRAAVPRMPLTAEMIEEMRNERMELADDFGESRRDIQAAWEQLPIPDSCPAIRQILWDGGDRLWVRRWEWSMAEPAAIPTYDVVTREGRWLGTVEVPSALGTVMTMTDDHVLTVWKNDMDVEFVHVYRILRPAAD